jgi:hypothetical protein
MMADMALTSVDLWALSDLCTPWCIHVAATLRVADRILAGNAEIGELAGVCGADPESLQRVLRHLIAKGVFLEPEPGQFAINDAARALIQAHLGFDLESFGGRMAHAWGTLLSAVRTGKPAYREAFGQPFWEDLEANPKIAADFDALMGPEGHGRPDPEVLLDTTGWDDIRTVVDVGGGTGALLAEVLRARPTLHGTLVDLPRTVERAAVTFDGIADRVNFCGQSFFDPLPAGADLYLLKSVLGDWPDAEATAILRRCAEAAQPSGRVVLLNGVTPDETPSPALLMMVLVGGKERTLSEFSGMAREAGLAVSASGRQNSGRFIVECRPHLL